MISETGLDGLFDGLQNVLGAPEQDEFVVGPEAKVDVASGRDAEDAAGAPRRRRRLFRLAEKEGGAVLVAGQIRRGDKVVAQLVNLLKYAYHEEFAQGGASLARVGTERSTRQPEGEGPVVFTRLTIGPRTTRHFAAGNKELEIYISYEKLYYILPPFGKFILETDF